jgi:hypothetical protein
MRNQPEPELELERVAGGEGREREGERGGRLIVGEETGERESTGREAHLPYGPI